MEETEAHYLMVGLMRAQYNVHLAIIRADRATIPNEENIQLRYLGSNLAIMGTINAAVTYQASNNQPARNLVNPISIQGFTFISGIAAMVIGWLLLVTNNPGQHRCLAKAITLLIQFVSVFTLGILLLPSSSSI